MTWNEWNTQAQCCTSGCSVHAFSCSAHQGGCALSIVVFRCVLVVFSGDAVMLFTRVLNFLIMMLAPPFQFQCSPDCQKLLAVLRFTHSKANKTAQDTGQAPEVNSGLILVRQVF